MKKKELTPEQIEAARIKKEISTEKNTLKV